MRNFAKRFGHGVFTIVLIFLMSLNFYVNVWLNRDKDNFVLELTPEHNSHQSPRFLWQRNKTANFFENTSRRPTNTTMRNTLDSPLFFQRVTIATPKLKSTSPASKSELSVWPSIDNYKDDRILKQLNFIPQSVKNNENIGEHIKMKKILLFNGYGSWGVKAGQKTFLEQKCPVNHCELTNNRQSAPEVDAVLFRQSFRFPIYPRPSNQVWIMYFLESPYYTPRLERFNGHINWTATYRHDSDIVAPYEKFVKYNVTVKQPWLRKVKNYASGKTKKVAWFVSNCRASNDRMEYARELSKYIQVDIFGKCGDKQCKRGENACSEMINEDYKFYLAFENSNCRDYITEKFFYNGLQHDVIPIVMGAAPEDYRRVAPHYSFIHVDEYKSARDLADYLIKLDEDDDLYNEYFKWKGTGEFINTYFWCRVCAMLHDRSHAPQSYDNIEEWWRGREVCIGRDRWGQHIRRVPYISDYYNQRKKS